MACGEVVWGVVGGVVCGVRCGACDGVEVEKAWEIAQNEVKGAVPWRVSAEV
jgi:hypothetical protein